MEIIVHDKAGNHKAARRIILFDDNSVVDKSGDEPRVLEANAFYWITEPSDVINIVWPGRYINVRHHNLGWLNAVREHADIPLILDDHTNISSRNIKEFHNIRGKYLCSISLQFHFCVFHYSVLLLVPGV